MTRLMHTNDGDDNNGIHAKKVSNVTFLNGGADEHNFREVLDRALKDPDFDPDAFVEALLA